MLDRLLESKAMRSRSPMGAMSSVAAHFMVIALAIHATAQSRFRPKDESRVVVIPFVPERPPTAPIQPNRPTPQPLPHRLPVPTLPIFDPKLPPIDMPIPLPANPTDFPHSGVPNTLAGGPGELGADSGTTFRSDQVERQVGVLPGAPLPRYPEALRNAGVEGQVIAEFVVNELGRVEADSVRFIRSDNVLFEAPVRNVLQRMRFAPAQIGGRNVRQLVRMPFVFTLSGR
ncbi:MAG TPA: TonB family protein [Gemmatimonadaceae bacterium]|nr:TonB family protein [Gemmatimonadaceae bacterium]